MRCLSRMAARKDPMRAIQQKYKESCTVSNPWFPESQLKLKYQITGGDQHSAVAGRHFKLNTKVLMAE